MNSKTVWMLILFTLASVYPAEAQQLKKIPRIGLLTWTAPPPKPSSLHRSSKACAAWLRGGQTIAIERRYANGQMERLPELAADLARLPLDVILTQSFPQLSPPSKRPQPSPSFLWGRRSGGYRIGR